MDVNETTLVKKLVNGECQPAPHPKDAAKKIRAWTKMRNLAQKLRRMPLLLQRIGVIGRSDDVYLVGDDFPFLAFALRSDQRPARANGGTSGQSLQRGIIRQRVSRDDLKVTQTRAIIQFDE